MRINTIIFSLLFFGVAQGQLGELSTNNSKIKVGNDGTFFHYEGTYQGYIIPQSSGKSTIHSASLWLSAIDNNKQSHLSAVVLSNYGSDFTPGPISNSPVETKRSYDKVYEIRYDDINDHKKDPSSNIYEIYNWPAHGDVALGEPAILAPFIDLNKNGKYEPEDGEYPQLFGDNCTYSIFNDQANQEFSKGTSMGLDIHQFIYQLSPYLDGDTLSSTNFARFYVVNRSTKDYSDFKFGVYINIGIGNPSDDFVGSDSTLSLAYGYNGDDHDETVLGYGLNPPMQGTMFLNTKLESSTLILQDDNEKNGLPAVASQYTNYLNGKFKDGTVKSISNQNLSLTSKYDYPGNLNNTAVFSEKGFVNTPGNRNVLMVAKPAYIGAGDTLIYDMAFPFSQENFGGATASYDSLINLANHIRNRYNSSYSWIEKAGDNRRTVSINKQKPVRSFLLYPNPSTGHFTIRGLETDKPSSITNLAGQVVKQLDVNVNSFNISNLESGVYFLKTDVGTMRLLKL